MNDIICDIYLAHDERILLIGCNFTKIVKILASFALSLRFIVQELNVEKRKIGFRSFYEKGIKENGALCAKRRPTVFWLEHVISFR